MSTITIDSAVVERVMEMLNRINCHDDDSDFLTEDEAVCIAMVIDALRQHSTHRSRQGASRYLPM